MVEFWEESMLKVGRAEHRLIGESSAICNLRATIERLAPTNASVLIVGETGSGKEVVARYLHEKGLNSAGPFVSVNCGAIPEDLAESLFFGHERGSFTGAHRTSAGYFEAAASGTVLLDEIQDMPAGLQVKLLRALETRTAFRVGGTEPVAFNTRIIAATNGNPAQATRKGKFREDLFFRLAAFTVSVPPLRRRGSDVFALAEMKLSELNGKCGTSKSFSKRSLQILGRYHWPGNVRELHNAIERAFILADDELELTPAPGPSAKAVFEGGMVSIPVGAPLFEAQQFMIASALRHFGGDKPAAARSLGISLKTLYNRLGRLAPSDAAQ
ncbi:sigma-54-dependent Fis family transcriptional regulator [Pandoraea nosoerga]|nr:sigma-54-dependent Fis family transcriptional regulator [Pandoraea nosoerga]MBN4677139.1 sigma-54-dependent Fis family transcriptional regulator [Pandoraea nosoerga]MBN4681824.1 sigma-54-dependent Fis family transcriptional regulator [Pandoraea nosoerga]MBN4746256.1 sigma-54-dependent Fis family transcriptional regulator [Pandoraea nosoerga]